MTDKKKVTDEHVPPNLSLPNLPFRCLDLDIVIVIHVFHRYICMSGPLAGLGFFLVRNVLTAA